MYSQSAKIVLIGLIALVAIGADAREIPVNVEDAPYLVQIKGFFGAPLCVGVLVSPTHVVTSANYVGGHDAKNVFVVIGAVTRSGEGEKYEVSEIFVPSDYTPLPRHMDVAVLKLSKAVTGTKNHPIDLCSKALQKDDEIAVTGWGAGGQFWGNTTDTLNRGTYTVIPYTECNLQYVGRSTQVTDTTFCADEYRNIVGDIGGPAVHDGEFCGMVCAGEEGYPGIFTDIYVAKDFIEKSIKG